MPDWLIRTIKTFIQSFFGVLIPEICIILNGGFPASVDEAWKVLAPLWRRLFRRLSVPHGTFSARS